MKVLIVSTNQLRPSAELPWEPVAPLGAAYVAASLRAHGHSANLVDLCFSAQWEKDLAEAIDRYEPEVIGVSLRNVEMAAYFHNTQFLGHLVAVIDFCRVCSAAKIVIGGSGFSTMPAEILRLTGLDCGIAGEGEWSFPELLATWEGGADWTTIPGVAGTKDGAIFSNAPDRSHSLVKSVGPARDCLALRSYIGAGGTANIQSKRGCRFECVYCSYPIVEGESVRCRPAPEVVDEFRELAEAFAVSSAYVVDSQFNDPPIHAKDVCEGLAAARERIKVRWSCMVNPAGIDEELVMLMRLARCSMVDLGIDTASEPMLEKLGKGFTRNDIARTVGLLRKCRIRFRAWILLGGPGETERTIGETLESLAAMGVPEVLFSIGLRIYPGTALERIARAEGRLAETDDLVKPFFYLSMDAERIATLVEPHLHGRKGWRIAARRHPDD